MKYQEIPKELISNWFMEKMNLSLNTEQLNDLCLQIDNHTKINYTRCCCKLKDKEPPTFEEWMKLKNMRELMTNFYWDGINLKVYTTSELMKIYIKTTL